MDGLWTVISAWALMWLIVGVFIYRLIKKRPVLSEQERELLATLYGHPDIAYALGKVSEEMSE